MIRALKDEIDRRMPRQQARSITTDACDSHWRVGLVYFALSLTLIRDVLREQGLSPRHLKHQLDYQKNRI